MQQQQGRPSPSLPSLLQTASPPSSPLSACRRCRRCSRALCCARVNFVAALQQQQGRPSPLLPSLLQHIAAVVALSTCRRCRRAVHPPRFSLSSQRPLPGLSSLPRNLLAYALGWLPRRRLRRRSPLSPHNGLLRSFCRSYLLFFEYYPFL